MTLLQPRGPDDAGHAPQVFSFEAAENSLLSRIGQGRPHEFEGEAAVVIDRGPESHRMALQSLPAKRDEGCRVLRAEPQDVRAPAHLAGFVFASPMANRCWRPRTMTMPSTIAGVAISTSPMGFVASSSNLGPALTT